MNVKDKQPGRGFQPALVFLIGILLSLPSDSQAQNSFPARSLRGEEFVSLNNAIPFDTAIDILNRFCQKYEKKIIVDPQRRTHPIGVVIDNMYWKKALEYILTSNGLKYEAYDSYYEIIGDGTEKTSVKSGDLEISTGTKEVLIEAIFFEADRKTLSKIGVDWTSLYNNKIRVDVTNTSGVTESAIEGAYRLSKKTWNVYALLKAIETSSKGEVLARPQIKVMEGVEGKVKVGTNFYLTTRDYAGNTRYREYEAGTILRVIPQVITINDTTFIHLDITAEKSQVIPDDAGVSKAITESQTHVLLLNNEQTVIAGLYSNERSNTRKGIPFLKDLPWWFFGLRYLFGYEHIQYEKRELVILIKAGIVPSIARRTARRLYQSRRVNAARKKMLRRKKTSR